jgi:hypothetical protein
MVALPSKHWSFIRSRTVVSPMSWQIYSNTTIVLMAMSKLSRTLLRCIKATRSLQLIQCEALPSSPLSDNKIRSIEELYRNRRIVLLFMFSKTKILLSGSFGVHGMELYINS